MTVPLANATRRRRRSAELQLGANLRRLCIFTTLNCSSGTCLAERGHTCPQQFSNASTGGFPAHYPQRPLLRAGMSALRARRIRRPALRLYLLVLALPATTAVCQAPYTLTNEWKTPIGSTSDSSPALSADGTIYFATWEGRLWALNPDGSRKWVFRAGLDIKSSPAVGADGTVYFGCRDRQFYALNANGKKKWQFKTRGWVDSTPALGQDRTIYFGSWDKTFYALNPDGTLKWQYQSEGEIVSSPAIGGDGTIYFGSHDRKFYALGPDGKKKWAFATGGPIISSAALNRDQCLYFTSVDGCLYSLNYDGSLRWRLRTGGISESSPVIGLEGRIYVGVNQDLWAITPDGKKLWNRWNEGVIESAPLALADGSISYVDRWGVLTGLDLERNTKWGFYLDTRGYGGLTVGATGMIYAPGDSTGFSALRANVRLAPTPWPKFQGNVRNTGNLNDNGH